MNPEHKIRMRDIREGPWYHQSGLAREKVAAMSDREARRYFRSHYNPRDRIEDQNEIAFRESFDQALEHLQLLELAVASGYLPLDVVRPSAAAELKSLLRSGPAKAYVKTYDYVPVRFLAARVGIDLGLGPIPPPAIDEKAAVRYAAFLALHSDFTSSEPIETFTMLLDDYTFYGRINAQFFNDRLGGKTGRLTGAQEATISLLCQGLVEFVYILGDLFLQLEKKEEPLFGSFYAYWLSHFLGIRRTAAGYEQKAVSFEHIHFSPLLFPPNLDKDALASEHARLRSGIRTLRDVWDETRTLIESLDHS